MLFIFTLSHETEFMAEKGFKIGFVLCGWLWNLLYTGLLVHKMNDNKGKTTQGNWPV